MWFPGRQKAAKSGRPAGDRDAAGGGRHQQHHNKGALRMELWVGVLRRVAVAVFLLGGVIVSTAVCAIGMAGSAAAQQIVVEGNRRVEASTIQSYFRLSPGERLDDIKINSAYKSLIETGLFQD